MSGRHTGVHLARELKALVKSFGIENKVRLLLSICPENLFMPLTRS